jgi:hypothetical protein
VRWRVKRLLNATLSNCRRHENAVTRSLHNEPASCVHGGF